MRQATERQLRVLRYVESFSAEHGYAPTIREMCTALGIRSTNGITDHLAALERKGYIRRDQDKARSIVVLRPSDGGTNPGGVPVETDEFDVARMSYRLGVEKAVEAVASCTRRRAVFSGVMLQVVDLDEALQKIRALIGKEGAR